MVVCFQIVANKNNLQLIICMGSALALIIIIFERRLILESTSLYFN